MTDRRELFFTPPGKSGQLFEISPDGSQRAVGSTSPSAKFNIYSPKTGRNINMNNRPLVKAAGAAASRYMSDPSFRQTVNETFGGIASTVKPAKPNKGDPMGYLSEAPNPAETSLNTGIRLTVLEKNYMKAQENVCSSMHTTHALFQFPSSSTDIVYDWYSKISTRDYQTRAQENVNWGIDINVQFSASNIILAMNALFKALQIYFFYRSIDTYCQSGNNNSDAIYSIQSEFDFNTRYKIQQIARLLSRIAIPPKMLEFCRYINSNYLSGETPNSPIIKIVPFPLTTNATMTSNGNLDTVITDLDNITYKNVWAVLSRVNKSWIAGTPDKIYDPPIETVYDRDFLTIFNNLPSANGISTSTVSPTSATSTTNFTYLSWTNNLDGIALALTDAWDFANSKTYNGFVIVLSTGTGGARASRFSYYEVSGVRQWYSSRVYPFLQYSRLDTYISDGATATVAHRFGSDMVINVSPLMISTTVVNAIDYLLSTSSMDPNVQRDNRPSPVRGRRGSNRSKSKGGK